MKNIHLLPPAILEIAVIVPMFFWANLACSQSGEKPVVVTPSNVENRLVGGREPANEHYVVQGGKATLELKFEADDLQSVQQIGRGILILKVPTNQHSNTKSTISVWINDERASSRKGAGKGQTLRFEIDGKHFKKGQGMTVIVRCGTDTVKISERRGDIYLECYTATNQSPPRKLESFANPATPIPHTGKVVGLAGPSSHILALLVVPLGDSRYAGLSSKLLISALPASGDNFATLRFNQNVGYSMESATEEVVRFHRLRHGGWPKDQQIELAFAEKYSSKDGPSAAVATALLIESLITGTQLDEYFAVTGDMNAAGDVQPIGGVAAKLRGAKKGGAKIVAIPEKNRLRALDLAMIDGIEPILATQIFSIKAFDQALMLASKEKTPSLRKAIKLFSEIQQAGQVVDNQATRGKLQEIVTLAPGHLSARIALMMIDGKFPAHISMIASLEEIDKILGTLPESASADLNTTKNLQLSELGEARSKLQRLRSKLDPRVRNFADAWIEWTTLADEFVTGRSGGSAAIAKLNRTVEKAKAERVKILSDESVQEELIQ